MPRLFWGWHVSPGPWDGESPWSSVGMACVPWSSVGMAHVPGPLWGRHVSPGPRWTWCAFRSVSPPWFQAQQSEALSVSSLTVHGAISSLPLVSMSFLPQQMFPKNQTDLSRTVVNSVAHLFYFSIKSFLKVLNTPGTLFALLSSLPLGVSIHLVTHGAAMGRVPAEQLRFAQDSGHGRGLALCLAIKLDGKPHQNFPAKPCGFMASDSAVTPSNSLAEKLAFPATTRPGSCRQAVVLENGLTLILSCQQSLI